MTQGQRKKLVISKSGLWYQKKRLAEGKNRLCVLMDKMNHPYIIYKKRNVVVSPWDVCLAIQSIGLQDLQLVPAGNSQISKVVCPHCGKELQI